MRALRTLLFSVILLLVAAAAFIYTVKDLVLDEIGASIEFTDNLTGVEPRIVLRTLLGVEFPLSMQVLEFNRDVGLDNISEFKISLKPDDWVYYKGKAPFTEMIENHQKYFTGPEEWWSPEDLGPVSFYRFTTLDYRRVKLIHGVERISEDVVLYISIVE